MFDVSLQDLKMFLSPAGQQIMLDLVRKAKDERGKGWIDHLKKQYPKFTKIFELVNLPEADALASLKKDFPLLHIAGLDTQLLTFHRNLNHEFNKKVDKFMFVPIIEIGNKNLLLNNFSIIEDLSTAKKSRIKATARSGAIIEFDDDDADDIADRMEEIVRNADAARLPIVGIDNKVLILFNFLMCEDATDDDDGAKAVLTTDDGDDLIFTGDQARLIISRMDTLTEGTNQIWQRLNAMPSQSSNN